MKVHKNALQNDQLLQDLKREAWTDDVIDRLKQANLTTYKQLFALIRDEQADPQLRADVCDEIRRLFSWIDKRRFVPPLLDALKTSHELLLQNAIQALGNLESKRAVEPIIKLVSDKTLSYDTRRFAILALCDIKDKKALPALINIMLDRSDDIKVREDAIEYTALFDEPSLVTSYIKLLSDPEPDMRFWAAYGFAVMGTDISAALGELDRVAAFDHQLPATWGWHIDREALMALEGIYWRKFTTRRHYWPHPPTYLISPAPEYDTFVLDYRTYNSDWFYGNLPTPNIDLKIDPNWLREKFLENWPTAQLNIREPRPKTYVLDWKLKLGRGHLIGGLHRDQYAVVLAGAETAILKFAVWFRNLISKEQKLFIYEWANLGYELVAGMTSKDIKTLLSSTYIKYKP